MSLYEACSMSNVMSVYYDEVLTKLMIYKSYLCLH